MQYHPRTHTCVYLVKDKMTKKNAAQYCARQFKGGLKELSNGNLMCIFDTETETFVIDILTKNNVSEAITGHYDYRSCRNIGKPYRYTRYTDPTFTFSKDGWRRTFYLVASLLCQTESVVLEQSLSCPPVKVPKWDIHLDYHVETENLTRILGIRFCLGTQPCYTHLNNYLPSLYQVKLDNRTDSMYSQLTITQVTPYDEGIWTCFARFNTEFGEREVNISCFLKVYVEQESPSCSLTSISNILLVRCSLSEVVCTKIQYWCKRNHLSLATCEWRAGHGVNDTQIQGLPTDHAIAQEPNLKYLITTCSAQINELHNAGNYSIQMELIPSTAPLPEEFTIDLPTCPVDFQLRTSNTSVVLTWTRGPNSGLNQTTLLYTRSNDSSADDLIGTVDDDTRDTLTYPLRHLDTNTTYVFSIQVRNHLGVKACPGLSVYMLTTAEFIPFSDTTEACQHATADLNVTVRNVIAAEGTTYESTTTKLPEPNLLYYIIPPVAAAVVVYIVLVLVLTGLQKGFFKCKQQSEKKQIVTSRHIGREPIPTPHEHNIGDGYLVVLDSRGDSNQNLQAHDQLGIEPWTSRFQHSARNRLPSSVINTAIFDVGAGTYHTTVDKYIDVIGTNTTQCMLVESDINRVHLASNDTVLYDPSGSLFGQPGYTREKYIDIRTCNAGQPTHSQHQTLTSDKFLNHPTRIINTELNPGTHNTHESNECSNVYETIE